VIREEERKIVERICEECGEETCRKKPMRNRLHCLSLQGRLLLMNLRFLLTVVSLVLEGDP